MILDYRPECKHLYRVLGVPNMLEPLLLANIILPHFGELAASMQEHVMARILEQWKWQHRGWRDNVALYDALAATPFVMTGNLFPHQRCIWFHHASQLGSWLEFFLSCQETRICCFKPETL